MHKIMVLGAGKIGCLIASLFIESKAYEVYFADIDFSSADAKRFLLKYPKMQVANLDVKDQESVVSYLTKNKVFAVISALPYFLNTHVACIAKTAKVHYFDLTEDTSVTEVIKTIASDAETLFVPQCGLAPGFVSIVANSLMQEFDQCLHAKLRVGALPQRANNALHYSLTWSTDGLINEYGNRCYGLENGKLVHFKPLEGRETLLIDGCHYEAFNTSGGLGGLADLYMGKVDTLNYKTIRYPGHCEKMRFLMNELQLNSDRPTLKHILERAIPKTYQDVVIIYVSVEGMKNGSLIEKSYIKKIYPQTIHGLDWSAIQISTATSLCVVVDLVLNKARQSHGLVLQESFSLAEVLENRFALYFKSE